MDKFEIIKILGEGTFGCVYRALNKVTGEIVAIKKLKDKVNSWEECLNLREVKSLMKMNNHPNVVKLIEVIKEFDSLYFVFENMEINLLQLLKGYNGKVFPPDESEVRGWCFQIFKALDYVHKSGYMHRDLKPENFLVSGVKAGNINIKMADFGMARELSSGPYTDVVCTQWYRAPEVMLGKSSYDTSMDMWSMGAIVAELFNLRPLFPGSRTQIEQMHKICSVIGSPDRDSWPEGFSLADSINYRFPQYNGVDLSILIPTASKNAISLISSLCSWDPRKRPTAAEALRHPFFNDCYHIPRPFPLNDCYLSDFSTANPMHASLFNAKVPERNFDVDSFSVGNITTDALLLNEAWLKQKFQMEYNLQLPSYQPPPYLSMPSYQQLPDLNHQPNYQPLPPLPDLNLPSNYQALLDLSQPCNFNCCPHGGASANWICLGLNLGLNLPSYQPLSHLNKPCNFNCCPHGGASDVSGTKNADGGQWSGIGYIDYKFIPPSHQKVEAVCTQEEVVDEFDALTTHYFHHHSKTEASTMKAGGGWLWLGQG